MCYKCFFLYFSLALWVVGCTPSPSNHDLINTYFDNLGSWDVTPADERREAIGTEQFVRTRRVSGQNFDARYVYDCQLYDVQRSAMFREVFVPGFSVADVLPGTLIQGSALRNGQIAILPIERADIDLRVDLSIEDATLTVASPARTNDVYDAVTQMRRMADPRLNATNIDIVAANLEYAMTVAYSYEQAMLDVGLSAEYAGESVRSTFDAAFSSQQTLERHTVMARLFHPMYTIVFDDHEITPAGFFASDVTLADIEQIAERGRLGADNLPLYIKSVTYGQMILFTISSSAVDSSTELEAAVSGAVGAFKGSATLDNASRAILQNSEISVYSIGGDRETAFAALRDGDLSQFFFPAPATTAEVLYMTVNTLDGNPAALVNRASFTEPQCNEGQAQTPQWYLVIENAENTYVWTSHFTDINVDNPRHILNQESGAGTVHLNPHFYDALNIFIIRNINWSGGGTQVDIFIYRGSTADRANVRYELSVATGAKWIDWVDILQFRIPTNPTGNCEVKMNYGELLPVWERNRQQGSVWQPCS